MRRPGLQKRTRLEHNPTASRGNSEMPARAATLFAFPATVKINIKRLDHVQLCVPRDGERQAREFYAGLLGLTEIEKPEPLRANGGMWFRIADVQLHIGVEDVKAVSKRHPAFEVEHVEEIRKFLEQNGVRTRDEPHVEGVRRFSFFDPFDNRIEFLEKTSVS
jgi:catechol 2,3-dioxygenase-like lactoylglutathione lyase family enzyme